MDMMNPLHGVEVVLTRPLGRSAELKAMLEHQGARVVERPLIQICTRYEPSIANALLRTNQYEAVIATSANAVRSAWSICKTTDTASGIWKADWYCIGRGTAKAARSLGLSPILFESIKNGQEFASALVEKFGHEMHRCFVFIHGQRADMSFIHVLQTAGLSVDSIVVYDTLNANVNILEMESLQLEGTVVYVFYSPSAVESLIAQWPDFSESRTYQTLVVTIGQTTSMVCEHHGILVNGIAKMPTDKDVADTILSVVRSESKN